MRYDASKWRRAKLNTEYSVKQ